MFEGTSTAKYTVNGATTTVPSPPITAGVTREVFNFNTNPKAFDPLGVMTFGSAPIKTGEGILSPDGKFILAISEVYDYLLLAYLGIHTINVKDNTGAVITDAASFRVTNSGRIAMITGSKILRYIG
jgi:hypothetical protein